MYYYQSSFFSNISIARSSLKSCEATKHIIVFRVNLWRGTDFPAWAAQAKIIWL